MPDRILSHHAGVAAYQNSVDAMTTLNHTCMNYEYDRLEKSMDEKDMRIMKWDVTDFELLLLDYICVQRDSANS